MHCDNTVHVYRGTAPRYDAVLLSITERCHVGCAHCGFIGTKREREATLDELRQWTGQLCEYGIPRLILTGGEPFERLDAMEIAVRTAASRIPIVATFTSSFWGTSQAEARYVLRQLAGLNQLYLSTDAFHQQRVPFENVHNVIDAALAEGLPYITLCITYSNDLELADVKAHYARWGSTVTFHEDRVIPTPYLSRRVMERQASGVAVSSSHYGRTCYLQTPLINPNGDLYACHSGKAAAHRAFTDSPYFLGNLREKTFAEIVHLASRRWDYQYLRTQGPKGVAELVERSPAVLHEVGRTEFTTACDMCFSILKTHAGTEALRVQVHRPEVQDSVNIRLAIGLGEDPITE